MKKTIILGSALALSLAGTPVAHAQEAIRPVPAMRPALKTIASTTRAEIKEVRVEAKEAIQDKRSELKAEIEVRKEALAQKRASTTAEIKVARINETLKNAQTHLAAESSRLDEIKEKIDSRMDKLSEAGADVSKAQASLDLAITAMNGADAKISALASIDASSADASTEIKAAVKDAQAAIDAAQKALLQVVTDMRTAEISVKKS
ncbi:MAG TPA: hypothetical protein VHC46_01720 [Thermodesulfobacteriota bacterium]|nr:hypothetical protein [Candidatus Paceibacterota bacterium]HVY54452.1 hypothetical protein [Thermodesulfobacteriota bacterium]